MAENVLEQPVASPTVRTPESGSNEKMLTAGQWRLIWRRFTKHRLALIGGIIILLYYTVVIGAEFFAYADPSDYNADFTLIPPQPIHLFDNGQFSPHVFRLVRRRDPNTFQLEYTPDPTQKVPLVIFGHGFPYKFLGVIPTTRHLIATADGRAQDALFLLGTDMQGRDMWSRIMYATRISLTIGLVGVAMSLLLGVLLGGVSGLYGGWIDDIVQRIIEVLRSIPTIPLWMGLAAALPRDWSILRVYFAITIIISLISWTELARVTRGRFLSLREEEFVTAAELDGCSQLRIILFHMVPSFLSHIIAATTLALPVMIISETALSFLGLGLRPPAISWGVMLQQAQNIQAIVITPWLLIPAIPVTVAVLAFNFLGDGLRDAADPYANS